jgi:hypothetical protein
MLSAKRITPERIKVLGSSKVVINFLLPGCFFLLFSLSVVAQDNSPYSRYGLGTISPATNILNRGMGGIVAGYNDPYTVNFTNPASYSSFKTYQEQRTKKAVSGRVILDAGINFGSRAIREGSNAEKFSSGDAYFSYIQVGIPLKNNWGMSFGIRPVSRIYYKLARRELLIDPQTNLPIDSALTEFKGDGGTFLPNIGTGFAIKNLSVGVTVGYMFGRKDFYSKRFLYNDTVEYKNANYETRASFGSLFYSAGIQYKINVNKLTTLTLGAYGNLQQKLKGREDIIRETFVRSETTGDVGIDSVNVLKEVKGDIVYPAQYGFGFSIEKLATTKTAGWLLGIDYVLSQWNNYRFFGEKDDVKDNWEFRVGGQYRPVSSKRYFSNVAYRLGFFTGPDYVNVGNKTLNQYGITLGAGLPLANYSRLSGQYTTINIALEYIKRGNNSNIVNENLFRVSLGLNLSDIWFGKKKYAE